MVLFSRYSTSSCFLFFGVRSRVPSSRGGALQATPNLGCPGEHCVNWDQVTPGPAGGELGGNGPVSHASQPTPRPALRTGRGLTRPLVAIIKPLRDSTLRATTCILQLVLLIKPHTIRGHDTRRQDDGEI